jgi:tetratricopeptide (TPR) repeat protein
MDLRDQLQQTLGDAYTLERELGGGGMSRVFVAEERALGRKVVVKVLPPGLSGGVNIERFKREIQVAAKLQHAHIVPVLAAGETSGLPYYTMPFVDGESLRARLARGGPMPITETISVLRDVARALSYAHEHGVVHRDIKPDNVMLSGGSAVVADFGIAKAISAARTEGENTTLTSVGTSLGTPAYIAPEQAAGDPATDHRADLYAFGCMAYEMLTGAPPFVEKTPQQLLAAHMAKTPESVTARRADAPPALAELVMRCLAKDAGARPQSAAEVTHILETVTSGGTYGTMPPILLASQGTMKRALGLYAAAFIVVAVLARAAIVGIGLPDWVFPGSLVVMALGLPVILFTGYVQRVMLRSMAATPTYTPGGSASMGAHGTLATMAMKASPHVSWRRTMMGGVYAVAGFVVLVGGFMVMRAFGIGPAGSLLGNGTLSASDQIIVADFKATGPDTVLSGVLAEAMRSSLSQSRAVRVVQTSAVAAALQRMARPADAKLDLSLAHEIAERDGIKGIVTGEVAAVSGGYLVTARLVAAKTGDVLASFQRSANGATNLIPVMDELGKLLRAKIGESLKAVQKTPPLAKATTFSIDALRKYSEANNANDVTFEFDKAAKLLNEAIAIDSNFAMAYRKLAITLGNGGHGDLRNALLEKAYARRDHFGEAERLAFLGEYYDNGAHRDRARSVDAYDELFRRFPEQLGIVGPHNFAGLLASRREFARAESLFATNIRLRPEANFSYQTIVAVQAAQGRFREALQSVSVLRARPAIAARADGMEPLLLYGMGNVDSASALLARGLASKDARVVARANFGLATIAMRAGRMHERTRLLAAARGVDQARGATANAIGDSLEAADAALWIYDSPAEALRILDATVAQMTPARRRSGDVAIRYATLGKPNLARPIAAAIDSAIAADTVRQRLQAPARHLRLGAIAFGEGRYTDAVDELRLSDRLPDGPAYACATCVDLPLALSFDRAGQADSAIAHYEHFVTTPSMDKLDQDALRLAWTLRRLGELYEAKHDGASAIAYYQKFLDLWKNADLELQPQVARVRAKLQQLADAERRKG